MIEPTVDAVPQTLASTLVYESFRCITHPLFTLGFSLRYQRASFVPPRGPALIIANHQSYLDPPIIGLAFNRQLVYLARKSLFRNPFFRKLIEGLNAVPIDQEGIGKDGLKIILDQLALGKAVVVFPEGTRTPNGAIQPLRPGIHLLIKRTAAPIIPIGIAGAYDAWPIWRKYPIPSPLFLPSSPRTIGLAVGQPLDPRLYADMPRDQAMIALQDELNIVHQRAEKLRRK